MTQPTQKTFKSRKPRSRYSDVDPLVAQALEFINKHKDNTIVFGCFEKKKGQLHTFGVYNAKTKKHSIHYATNFYPCDLEDIKFVALER